MSEFDRLVAAHACVAAPGEPQTAAARRRLAALWAPEANAGGVPAPAAHRRRVVAIAGLVLAAVAFVAFWPSGSGSVRPVSAASAASLCRATANGPAAPCLNAIGAVAAVQPAPSSAAVTYQRAIWNVSSARFGPRGAYRVDRPLSGATAAFSVSRYGEEETWVAPGLGARAQYSIEGHARPSTVADARVWRASGSPDLDRLMGPRGGWGPRRRSVGPSGINELLLGAGELSSVLPSPDPLRGMPVEPEALHQYLRTLAWRQRTERSGEGDDACKLKLSDCPAGIRATVEDFALIDVPVLLRYPFAPPALRKGLFGVFAAIPGVRSLGTLRDPAGRLGAAILLPGDGNDGQNVILFAPATSRLLAIGSTDLPRIDHIHWTRIEGVQTATVARIGVRPHRR